MYKHIPSSSKSNKTSICLRRTKKFFARKQSESQGRLTGLAGRQCRQGVKGTSYLKSLLKNPKPDARTTVAVVSWVIKICWEMVPGHINATCEQEALGLSEKWNESTTSLKGLPAQNVTPCPRQLSEASAIPWGVLLLNPVQHSNTHGWICLKEMKGQDFPGGAVSENPSAYARDMGLILGPGEDSICHGAPEPGRPHCWARSATRGAAAMRDRSSNEEQARPQHRRPRAAGNKQWMSKFLKKQMKGQHNTINGI